MKQKSNDYENNIVTPQHSPKKKTILFMLCGTIFFVAVLIGWFITQRTIFGIILIITIVLAMIHLVNMMVWGRKIEYTEIEFFSPKVNSRLDGYKIGFVTDLHSISKRELEKVVQTLNQENLDALLIGGDFDADELLAEQSIELLGHIHTKDGSYGVEGNHDYFEKTFAKMSECGIRALNNEGVFLQDGLFLAGVEDFWNRNPDLSQATADAKPEDIVIVLSHNPDVAMQEAEVDFDLMLSGHTHGGQIRFFGFLAPAIYDVSQHGNRFLSGWSEGIRKRKVYVSRGTGTTKGIPRIFSRPEVTILYLTKT